MGKVDDLRTKYDALNVTMFDILNTIDTTPTKKYLDMFCKVTSEHLKTVSLVETLDSNEKIMSGFITMIKKGLVTKRNRNIILEYFELFIEHNEKGNIPVNDVQKYKTINDIEKSVNIAEEKKRQEELMKQVTKFYEDDEWSIIQPHNLQSSQKYGNSTRWCTVSDSGRFTQYTSNNKILIYIINKKHDNKKVAVQRNSPSSEPDFWDSGDTKRSVIYLMTNNILNSKILDEVVKALSKAESLATISNKKIQSQKIQTVKIDGEEIENMFSTLEGLPNVDAWS